MNKLYMGYTPEQQIKFANYLGYSYEIDEYYFSFIDSAGNSFELPDWNIIKRLESKMCDELTIEVITIKKMAIDTTIEYNDFWLMAKGISSNSDKLQAEKECILSAVWQHINKDEG